MSDSVPPIPLPRPLPHRDADALREVSTIGAGHAATALSDLTARRISLSPPEVRTVPVEEISTLLGGWDTPVVGLTFRLRGDIHGRILLGFPLESACSLVAALGLPRPTAPEEVGEMEESALMEIGNIIASSYLSSLGDLLHLTVLPSVPGFSLDMAGAVVDGILIEIVERAEEAVILGSELVESARGPIRGGVFLLPDAYSLSVLVQALDRVRLPFGGLE